MFSTKRNYIKKTFSYVESFYNNKDISLSIFHDEKDDDCYFAFLVNTMKALEGCRYIEEWVAIKLNTDIYDPMQLDGIPISQLIEEAENVYLMTIKHTYSNEEDISLEYLTKSNALNMVDIFQDAKIQKNVLTIGEPDLRYDGVAYPYSLTTVKIINKHKLKGFKTTPCQCMKSIYGDNYKYEPGVDEYGDEIIPCECGNLIYGNPYVELAKDKEGNYFLMSMYDDFDAGGSFYMYSGSYLLDEDVKKILEDKVDYKEFSDIESKFPRSIKVIHDDNGTTTYIDVY